MALNLDSIKKIMIKKNINNVELAKKMNTSESRVSKILGGYHKTCRINTIHSLAEALEVEPEDILKEDC